MTDPLPVSGFGILDEDDLWMGSREGPNVYGDEIIARCAQAVLALQFPGKHFRVEPFTNASRIRDEITPDITHDEALALAESATRDVPDVVLTFTDDKGWTDFPPLRLVKSDG